MFATARRRLIGSPKLQIIFHKRAFKYSYFCGKWPIKIRDPMSLRHPVSISCYALQHDAVSHIVLLCVATERCNTTHSCETLHHICGAPLYWYEWVICHICARVVHLSSTYVTYNSFISMEWCTSDMTQKSGAPQIWPNRVVHHIYDTDSIQWSTTLAFRGAPQIWHSSIPWCTFLAKFSKSSSLLNPLCKMTIELTFEKLQQ